MKHVVKHVQQATAYKLDAVGALTGYDSTLFDHYVDKDPYNYTETFGEIMTPAHAKKIVDAIPANTPEENYTDTQRRAAEFLAHIEDRPILNLPRYVLPKYCTTLKTTVDEESRAYKWLRKFGFIRNDPIEVDITEVTEKCVYAGKYAVRIEVEENKELHAYSLQRAYHYVVSKQGNVGSLSQLINDLRKIRLEVANCDLRTYALLACKIYAEDFQTTIHFIPEPVSMKRRQERNMVIQLTF